MRKNFYYNPKLKNLARELRKHGALSEVILWGYLKGKKMKGYKFLRQKPINNYIVDFFCPELSLAIEIDGHTHGDKIEEDAARQKTLENLGIKFLRFTDSNVKQNIDGVLSSIGYWIDDNA